MTEFTTIRNFVENQHIKKQISLSWWVLILGIFQCVIALNILIETGIFIAYILLVTTSVVTFSLLLEFALKQGRLKKNLSLQIALAVNFSLALLFGLVAQNLNFWLTGSALALMICSLLLPDNDFDEQIQINQIGKFLKISKRNLGRQSLRFFIWCTISLILSLMAIAFLSFSLADPDFRVRLLIRPDKLAMIFVFPLATILYAARHWKSQYVERQDTPEILILRSFIDDRFAIAPAVTFPSIWNLVLKHYGVMRNVFCLSDVERCCIKAIGNKYTPIALGEPGETLPPMGALRTYANPGNWQGLVREKINSSAAIILICSYSDALAWELTMIKQLGRLGEAIFVVPPVNDINRQYSYLHYVLNQLGMPTKFNDIPFSHNLLLFHISKDLARVDLYHAPVNDLNLEMAVKTVLGGIANKVESSRVNRPVIQSISDQDLSGFAFKNWTANQNDQDAESSILDNTRIAWASGLLDHISSEFRLAATKNGFLNFKEIYAHHWDSAIQSRCIQEPFLIDEFIIEGLSSDLVNINYLLTTRAIFFDQKEERENEEKHPALPIYFELENITKMESTGFWERTFEIINKDQTTTIEKLDWAPPCAVANAYLNAGEKILDFADFGFLTTLYRGILVGLKLALFTIPVVLLSLISGKFTDAILLAIAFPFGGCAAATAFYITKFLARGRVLNLARGALVGCAGIGISMSLFSFTTIMGDDEGFVIFGWIYGLFLGAGVTLFITTTAGKRLLTKIK